jgi:hypothetical protein
LIAARRISTRSGTVCSTDEEGKDLRKWEKQNEIANKLYMVMAAFAKVGIIGGPQQAEIPFMEEDE